MFHLRVAFRVKMPALAACFWVSTGFGQTTRNMTQMSNYIRPGTTSACSGIWGWTSPVTNKEYALMSSRNPGGLCVVDISNPSLPALNVYIPAGHNSIWFEVNSYRNYAYMVSQEGNIGLQIIDLNPVNSGQPARLVRNITSFFTTAHTLFIDSTATPPRLYATYGYSEGVVILSLANPEGPVELGRIPGESHDMYAKGGRMYLLTQRKGTVDIRDVSAPGSTQRLGVINLVAKTRELGEISDTSNTVAHNAWPSDDGKILFTTEEIRGVYGKSWDISTPSSPRYLGRYLGVPNVIAHNFYVKGSRLYVAHNNGGLRVLDIGDPANMTELGWHRPANNGNSWGAYPYFKSGYIIHGDDRLGLFVVREDFPSGVAGGNNPREGFSIRPLHDGNVHFQLPSTGGYALSIFTLSGREVFTRRAWGMAGAQSLPLDRGGLAGGAYVARLSQSSGTLTLPITTPGE